MPISSYQIQNVLNAYVNQLRATIAGEQTVSMNNHKDSIRKDYRLSTRGKREAVIEKVAENIIERIAQLRMLSPTKPEQTAEPASYPQNGRKRSDFLRETVFAYHVIDQRAQKIKKNISLEESNLFIRR